MSRRERPAPGLAGPAPKSSTGCAAPVTQPRAAEPAGSRAPDWEECFHAFSPAQREELLALAQCQGLLYSFQLPTPANGQHAPQSPDLLAQLLAVSAVGLEPSRSAPLEVIDADLDAVQREAVARALATPDICLIQGLPGTGKSRVVAEIIRQITARGKRVLFLAPSTAALDRALESLASCDTVFALRSLIAGESVESLSPGIRRFTLAEQEKFLRIQATERARRHAEESEQRRARLERLAFVWPRLEELAVQWQVLDETLAKILERRTNLTASIEAEAGRSNDSSPATSIGPAVAEQIRARDRAFETIGIKEAMDRKELDTIGEKLHSLDEQRGRIRPLVTAWEQRKFLSVAWWWALIWPGLNGIWSELQRQWDELQKNVGEVQAKIDSLQKDRAEAEAEYQTTRKQLVDAEVVRRQTELDLEENKVTQAIALIDVAWQAASTDLDSDLRPTGRITPAAVAAAKEQWSLALEQMRQEIALAQQWSKCLEQSHQAIFAHLPAYVNVLAATTADLAHENHPGEAAANGTAGPGRYDYLVLEEADQVAEAALLKAARRTARWILIGQSESESSTLPFQRLWQLLHRAPRQLPYCWQKEKDRLHCRLRLVRADQQQWIERERVADFPEIELRILSLPQAHPSLAEIVFPSTMSIAQAKQFILNELQELAVQTDSLTSRWVEDSERVAFSFTDYPAANEQAVQLGSGVSEILHAAALSANGDATPVDCWQTASIEFDRRQGWTRQFAEQWISQRLGLCDLGRTMYLGVLQRMQPSLGIFLAGILSHARPRPARQEDSINAAAAVVEFVPVPALAKNSLLRRGGAGVELDLADQRQRERLPIELRSALPKDGIVNHFEAQAVVRGLSELAVQLSAAIPNKPAPHQNGSPATVAVLAVYPAQAELIRQLVERAPALADAPVKIEIGEPAAFRQREAAVVLLSLTRSHTHRPVAYGTDPEMLALAMTRACSRLIVFGDAGTLVRRSHWDGPLEHLDKVAAAREQQLVSHLVQCLDDRGQDRRAFSLRQGSGS